MPVLVGSVAGADPLDLVVLRRAVVLRDATGEIEFGQFTNQIEYQDAGSAINNAMKQEVLAPIDTGDLTGKTVTVTGVFKLINPNNWLVTPVSFEVQ